MSVALVVELPDGVTLALTETLHEEVAVAELEGETVAVTETVSVELTVTEELLVNE